MNFLRLRFWPAIVGFAISLGLLVDLRAIGIVEKYMSTILPIGVFALILISISGVIYFGGMVMWRAGEWFLDQVRGGPKRRRFKRTVVAIRSIITKLSIFDSPSQLAVMLTAPPSIPALEEEMCQLSIELGQLGIGMPVPDIQYRENRQRLVEYLERLAVTAQSGNLERARRICY